MKKFLFALLSVLTLGLLTGCGKFSDGTSVWQGGLWLVAALPAAGALIFGFLGFKDWKSGTQQTLPNGQIVYSDKKLPFYKVPYFIYSAALIVATIAIVLLVNADK